MTYFLEFSWWLHLLSSKLRWAISALFHETWAIFTTALRNRNHTRLLRESPVVGFFMRSDTRLGDSTTTIILERTVVWVGCFYLVHIYRLWQLKSNASRKGFLFGKLWIQLDYFQHNSIKVLSTLQIPTKVRLTCYANSETMESCLGIMRTA